MTPRTDSVARYVDLVQEDEARRAVALDLTVRLYASGQMTGNVVETARAFGRFLSGADDS